MQLNVLSIYVGPNLHAPVPAIRSELRLGDLEPHSSSELGANFIDRLVGNLPPMEQPKNASPANETFAEQLTRGLHMACVMECLIMELQRRTGAELEFSRTWHLEEPGVHEILFAYRESDSGIAAARLAMVLINYALPEHLRSFRVPSGFDIGGAIDKFLRASHRRSLGQMTLALLKSADARGIPWFRVSPHARLVQLGHGRLQHRMVDATTHDTRLIASRIAHSKILTNTILGTMGLPVPQQLGVADEAEALRAADTIGYPVVVKPISTDKGIGVSVGVGDPGELRLAFQRAAIHGVGVIVEQLILGDEHRLLMVNGRLVAAARRDPAAVIGDGQRTIEELVHEINQDPRRGFGHEKILVRIELDAESDKLLATRSYDRSSIPMAGDVVRLRRTSNISSGGTAVDVTDVVHPANRRMAERAMRGIGLDIAGIDFITPDISRSYKVVGGGICEVNVFAGLRPHWLGDPTRDVTGAVMDAIFPPDAPARVPIVAVTGTNGKTTTCRMVGRILEAAGHVVGLAVTDGVYIAGEQTVVGDLAGPIGALAVLKDPDVDAAVLETSRGALIRSGIRYGECDVGVVLNVTEDHLGFDGIETLDEMAAAKQLVVKTATKTAVLNADDTRCVAMAEHSGAERVCFVTINPENNLVAQHIQEGGQAVILHPDHLGQPIHVWDQGEEIVLMKAEEIPATLSGKAAHNIRNALFAVAAAYGLGKSVEVIRESLAGFSCDCGQTPGRTNVYTGHPFTVILDFAHNPAKLAALCELVLAMHQGERRIAVIGTPGNRKDEHYRAMAKTAAGDFDYFICSRWDDPRGRGPMEVQELLRDGLLVQGVAAERIEMAQDEVTAVKRALELARAGDIVALGCKDHQRAWEQVLSHEPASHGG